ncbi:cupin domain-containing protein [Steroidobacter sp. S1-65]|uniref:Cupin domain-containing protein n=1 Tax=Steroidobacter gossypii TaxID=2805490 RepID=A0ABS1WUT4_9GAMM|nr:cupin domain-containing protein [Steroidobacter gossypii]MBM0104731.1 cupin domain-containing protein [Steroidobacter gossypii]
MFKLKQCGMALAAACALMTTAQANDVDAAHPKVTELFTKALSDYPGKEALMITVEFPPGAMDPVHKHDAHAFVYVVEGSIVMGVKGGREVTLKAGDTFYEAPTDIHTVGRNASKTESAKFLVLLLKNQGEQFFKPLN